MDTRFVLLTAAKNEEQYIEYAIRSVVRQTIHPLAWFIVDDGSTDRTAEIIRDYAKVFPCVRLVSRECGQERSFGAQYRAINMAYALAQELNFDFIGVQDADIEVESDGYYEGLLAVFARDARLGVAGGYIFERKGEQWRRRHANSPDAVAGGIQMFRRACFDQIGGYSPLLFGGEDWLAQIDAKRAGWMVSALPDLAAHHFRPTSSADGRLKGLFRLGMMDASFGSYPVFEVLKCARRLRERPILLASFVRLFGYLWFRATIRAPLLPETTVAYLRREQIRKIYGLMPSVGSVFRLSASRRGAIGGSSTVRVPRPTETPRVLRNPSTAYDGSPHPRPTQHLHDPKDQ